VPRLDVRCISWTEVQVLHSGPTSPDALAGSVNMQADAQHAISAAPRLARRNFHLDPKMSLEQLRRPSWSFRCRFEMTVSC
jgi:hypothetical protein